MKKLKKDEFTARLSFYLSLGFWIPLFNIGLTIVSIYYAISALKLINNNPEKFGGLWYAIWGLVISLGSLILSLVFVIIYTYRQVTCDIVAGI